MTKSIGLVREPCGYWGFRRCGSKAESIVAIGIGGGRDTPVEPSPFFRRNPTVPRPTTWFGRHAFSGNRERPARGARLGGWVSDLDAEGAESVAARIGETSWPLALDVRRPDDWRAAEQAILARDGRLDVLVNNAGITGLENGAAQDVASVTLDDWRVVLGTNLEGVVLGCQMAIRAMRRGGGGSIVNIGSRSGHVGIPAAAAYAASKAAVLNHTRRVALYCAERDLNT